MIKIRKGEISEIIRKRDELISKEYPKTGIFLEELINSPENIEKLKEFDSQDSQERIEYIIKIKKDIEKYYQTKEKWEKFRTRRRIDKNTDGQYNSILKKVRESAPKVKSLEKIFYSTTRSCKKNLLNVSLEQVEKVLNADENLEEESEKLEHFGSLYFALEGNRIKNNRIKNNRIKKHVDFIGQIVHIAKELLEILSLYKSLALVFGAKKEGDDLRKKVDSLENKYKNTVKNHQNFNFGRKIDKIKHNLDYVLTNHDEISNLKEKYFSFGENLNLKVSGLDEKKVKELKNNLEEKIKKEKEEEKKRKEKRLADYWNSHYKISDKIIYVARKGLRYDVREFIYSDDAILKSVVKKERLEGRGLDKTAYRCMRFVQDNIKYVSDIEQFNQIEEWLFPTDTLQYKKGDCEDGTNLMISLMRNANVPAFRVKNACGLVKTSMKEGKEGHSWPLYLREDDEWIALDWCFLPSRKGTEERKPAKKRKEYAKILFTFNDEHSWAESKLEIKKEFLHGQGKRNNNLKIYESFSLPLFLDQTDIPNSCYPLVDILRGNDESWYNKLRRFNAILSDIEFTDDQNDIKYIKRLKFGLEKEIENGLLAVEVNSNSRYQPLIQETFNSLDSYISKSEESIRS